MTLAELRVGDRAKVVKLGGSGAIKRRLLDMGFTAGSEILVERYAPLLDPVEIRIRGYALALRVAECKLIEVELLS